VGYITVYRGILDKRICHRELWTGGSWNREIRNGGYKGHGYGTGGGWVRARRIEDKRQGKNDHEDKGHGVRYLGIRNMRIINMRMKDIGVKDVLIKGMSIKD
jgi:hypothetical protein